MGITVIAENLMRFYNREKELTKLRSIEEQSKKSSKMTVLVGRRRIGKTKLIKEAFKEKIYFFVSRKNESLLCDEFVGVVEATLQMKIHGEFHSFAKLFEYLIDLSAEKPFTLVIDEFQEFLYINPSLYSDLQNIWDEYKDRTHLNLVLSGSIFSLMKRIFEDRKEPLFGRADTKIHLQPFSVGTLKKIMSEEFGEFDNDSLLSLYTFTGGVAKYVELFVNAEANTLEKQLDLIFDDFSIFLDEGKNLLIEEFGKEYTVYFSILSLLASSKTSRSEIESILERDVGGYLDRLENEYTVIKRIRPMFSKPGGRTVKYEIADNFFNFWFRFIYKYKSAIELENYEYVKKIVMRDYATYSGIFLEKYFREKLRLTYKFSDIGSYWERNSHNEIDIIAVNDDEKRILFGEVKRQKRRISLDVLKEKSKKIVQKYNQYSVEYIAYSLEDI